MDSLLAIFLCRTSDVPKHDVFSGKLDLSLNKVVSIRRSPVVNAAVRSSSESSSGFQGRYSGACIDQACPLSCPVNREANVERWVEESVHDVSPIFFAHFHPISYLM